MNIKKVIAASIERDFLEYQNLWLKDQSRFKIGLWARQTGKDYTCAAEAVFDCVLNPKTHWLILACGERQARESLEKARDWSQLCSADFSLPARPNTSIRTTMYTPNPHNPVHPVQNLSSPSSTRHSSLMTHHFPKITRQSKTEIRFSNGSRITALPAKPGTV